LHNLDKIVDLPVRSKGDQRHPSNANDQSRVTNCSKDSYLAGAKGTDRYCSNKITTSTCLNLKPGQRAHAANSYSLISNDSRLRHGSIDKKNGSCSILSQNLCNQHGNQKCQCAQRNETSGTSAHILLDKANASQETDGANSYIHIDTPMANNNQSQIQDRLVAIAINGHKRRKSNSSQRNPERSRAEGITPISTSLVSPADLDENGIDTEIEGMNVQMDDTESYNHGKHLKIRHTRIESHTTNSSRFFEAGLSR